MGESSRRSRTNRETGATTTKASGTIAEYHPGSTIALRESSGPRHYHFDKTVTYVTKSGRTLDEESKVGIPVHVHYLGEGATCWLTASSSTRTKS